ncbi:POK10 protein, partial [Geococcyx californianus]|nr:POK10 protein [Geococcyx californianus]
TVKLQPLTLQNEVKTLNDAQKLMDTIDWVRPMLIIATHKLRHLFEILKGDADLSSP